MVHKSHSNQSNISFQTGVCDVSGLTTKDALVRLHDGIKKISENYKSDRSKWKWIWNTVSHSNGNSVLCWISMSFVVLCSLILITISFLNDDENRYDCLGIYGSILLILTVSNITIVFRDSYLCYNEIFSHINNLLLYLSEITSKCKWKPENYPHLCSPYSPCITLQWTYRDGSLVNLPWSLLVEGDLVLIKPGQPAPGHCVPFSDDCPELQAGQVYTPVPQDKDPSAVRGVGKLSARSPLNNKLYKLKETPFLNNLKLILNDSDNINRPVTFYNIARHLLIDSCVEQLGLPILLCLVLLVNIIRCVYMSEWVGTGTMLEMFVIIPICVVLPLLPLVFPMLWVLLSSYGNMLISATLIQKTNSIDKSKEQADPFDEVDLVEKGSQIMETKLPWKMRWKLFIEVLFGRQKTGLIRSANLLHVLGSVNSLCCVDKKGILSWPNPTAEKIFFLRKSDTPSCSSQDNRPKASENVETPVAANNNLNMNENICKTSEAHYDNELKPSNIKHSGSHSHTGSSTGHMQPEVLDLTHDRACPFKLEFDDAGWKRHLLSLKPMGLAILLNTCNMDTQEHYTQFCSHVTCEALYNEDLIPITNRRCLCEVAKQIGFTDSAKLLFKLESQLSTFRHVQPESVRNDMRFARALPPSTKLKFPFPHMVAVIMKEQTKNGGLQLFSQGTADIILDCCVEYWDGHKLCKLSSADRRKVQDFYQRTSLSAYCTAFAYRPLFRGAEQWLSDIYMELPMGGQSNHAPSPLPGAFSQFQSIDSLMSSEIPEPNVNDIEGCFKLQSNQVFIGMVTMQYQAQADIVQLIEQLESACIRFVHFSKENELRSRVFSEKVGLESGWNCHISLLSDVMISRSQSIDPDQTVVDDYDPTTCDFCDLGCDLTQSCDGALQPLLTKGTYNSLLKDSKKIFSSSTPCMNYNNSLSCEQIPLLKINRNIKSLGGISISEAFRNTSEDFTNDNDSVILANQPNTTSGDCQSQSLSCLTDSTEQSVPVNFDMSNRAKLPRGIENIKPHLEMVDNVPLLVSLFTDCTPTTTREMISIMQEYGEVVCVMGSSANAENVGIFIQANASIAVEPLYPQVCQKVSVCKPTDTERQGPSPIYISKLLNSLPCSVSICREDSFSIFHLIMKARHYMMQVWNCTQYWVCCVVSLSCAQCMASLLMLPQLFSTGQVIWLSMVVIPLLSLSLVSSSPDPQIMKRATEKKASSVNFEVALFVFWCYGIKFFFTISLIPILFAAILSSFCEQIIEPSSNNTRLSADVKATVKDCSYVYPYVNNNDEFSDGKWGGWNDNYQALLSVQHLMVFLLTIHFITISVSFVHRDYLCWQKSPHRSKIWLILLFIVFFMQTFYSSLSIISISRLPSNNNSNNAISNSNISVGQRKSALKLWDSVQLTVIIIILVSPTLVFVINEFVKWQEIKANVRYQKRARLEFGTKLGMNSPF